jgi:hypothetical protein
MPSGLYNGMIQPLVPYALRGAIWYQGEGNVGNHVIYRELLPALITGWRSQFAQGDFPFYWVQLANYNSPTDTKMAFFREAQTLTLSVPATGQAVSIDSGDIGNIHPARKMVAGRRLARVALARVALARVALARVALARVALARAYGQKIIESSPTRRRRLPRQLHHDRWPTPTRHSPQHR